MTGHTFSGHTAACAAALAVQRIIERDQLLERVRTAGAAFQEAVRDSLSKFEEVGDVRGRGFFIGIELVHDRKTRAPFPAEPGVELRYRPARIRRRPHMLSVLGQRRRRGRRHHHSRAALQRERRGTRGDHSKLTGRSARRSAPSAEPQSSARAGGGVLNRIVGSLRPVADFTALYCDELRRITRPSSVTLQQCTGHPCGAHARHPRLIGPVRFSSSLFSSVRSRCCGPTRCSSRPCNCRMQDGRVPPLEGIQRVQDDRKSNKGETRCPRLSPLLRLQR